MYLSNTFFIGKSVLKYHLWYKGTCFFANQPNIHWVKYHFWYKLRVFVIVFLCLTHQYTKRAHRNLRALFALQDGLEPTTPWLTVMCSNQLSYWSRWVLKSDAKVRSISETTKYLWEIFHWKRHFFSYNDHLFAFYDTLHSFVTTQLHYF